LLSDQPGAWRVARKWLPHREGIGVRARFRRVTGRRDRRQQPPPPDGSPVTSVDQSKVPARAKKDRWYDMLDVGDGCGGDLEDLVIGIGLLVAFGLLVFVFPPLILIGIDLLWLVVVFAFGLLGRVVLGRPWSVVATSSSGDRREWKVRGFGGAGQLRDTLQAEFDAGLDPHPDRLGL
jgi:hypothetical protein